MQATPQRTDGKELPAILCAGMPLQRDDQNYHAEVAYSCATLESLIDCREKFLHPRELAQWSALKFPARQRSFLLGRFCAKYALTAYLKEPDHFGMLRLGTGVFSQPVVYGARTDGLQISISHTDDWGVAIACAQEHPMGIDIETVDAGRMATIRTQLTVEEVGLIEQSQLAPEIGHTLLWTAKEALSKALTCGMMTPFSVLAAKEIICQNRLIVTTFANFYQYKAVSFTFCGIMCSIVLPKKTRIPSELTELADRLESMFASRAAQPGGDDGL